MAKKADEQAKSVINLAVPIQRHVVDKYLLEKFANAKLKGNSAAQGSLAEYIEQTLYKGKKVVIVPDLSNGHFEGMDLSGLDFTGCKLSGANFQFCKLEGAVFADCDLSGLDFTGAHLQRACFSGANMKDCNFTGADLSQAVFESATIAGAKFVNTTARDTNFFYCDMSSASIASKSDFRRAFMRGSDGTGAIVKDSNFNYANIQHGRWNDASISDSQFNYADLEGISLAGAGLRRVSMQYSILDKVIMEGVEMAKVDSQGSLMNDVVETNAKIKDSILKDIEARRINLTDAELDKLCTLEGAALQKAIMTRIETDGVNLRKADLRNAELEKAKAKGADVSGAKVNEGTNLAGADVENTKGKMAHHNMQGNTHEIAASDKVKNDDQVKNAKQKNKTLAGIGNALKGLGGFVEKGGDYVRQPFGAKWGRVIGAVAGPVLLGGLAVSAVFTAGASVLVVVAVIGGAGLLEAGTGAVAGHYAAKK